MAIARVGDQQIHYEVHGEGPGIPALLVMGLMIDAHGWEKQVEPLSEARKVITLDNRGVGRSSKPKGPYTTAELAADAIGVLDAAGVPEAHVVGLSLGGMIAQQIAITSPSRVRSLALLATYDAADDDVRRTADEGAGQSTDAKTGKTGIDLRALLKGAADGSVTVDFLQIMQFLAPLSLSMKWMQANSAYLQQFFARSMAYGLSTEGFAGQVAAALEHDARAQLGSIAAPTLVIGAEKDRLTPVRLARRLASAIPGARYEEIAGAAHGINFEHADHMNERLAAWFAEHDATETRGAQR